MKVVSLLVVGAASTNLKEIADTVNSGNHGWTAHVPSKFDTIDDVVPHLGAFLPGHEEFQEPSVAPMRLSSVELPEEFDSATNWPKCSVIGNVRDQSACGSCWAFGSVASFESRRCIATGEDIKFSPEDTAFCSTAGFGCNGGNSAWNWFESSGVVTGGDHDDAGADAGCLPYSFAACAHHVPATAKFPACPSGEYPSPECTHQCSNSDYPVSYDDDKHKASSAYSIRSVSQIQQDLVENGPIYVSFSVYEDFPTYKSGVYSHQTGSFLGGHAVTLVGYGTLDGTPYWKVKNSWNEDWGDHGHFLIKRGSDECGIESNANAGTFTSTEVV
jgi:cathepsin B